MVNFFFLQVTNSDHIERPNPIFDEFLRPQYAGSLNFNNSIHHTPTHW